MRIVTRQEIEKALDFPSLIAALREGFIAYHQGQAVVAPITNIALPEHNGNIHIKPSNLPGSAEISVKVVTCYYDNPQRGLPPRDGAIFLANRTDGRMTAILADAGLITDIRTAGSSAFAVDALASPGEITLGLGGAGTQAYWQAAAIAAVRSVANVRVWAREATARRIRHDLSLPKRVAHLDDAALAQVVVTATPAQVPILSKETLSPESLVVAMGADALGRRELWPAILPQAQAFVVDILSQCERYGELNGLIGGQRPCPSLNWGRCSQEASGSKMATVPSSSTARALHFRTRWAPNWFCASWKTLLPLKGRKSPFNRNAPKSRSPSCVEMIRLGASCSCLCSDTFSLSPDTAPSGKPLMSFT